MYFKQIELVGFKSFADRTELNLDNGMSAVVGPNGCGKSNILDALRWALGEQSAKALRGAHMQDVIFNGSEHRPATGMAEVSLTFDNVDSRLPVDFSEVQVTRRVYRSGESEYLLNKAPCRLRDIQELFMDTGIGTNAYSLIGQGKIDMVLSSKPEDRRFLFEEAAGIIKYKSRKRTAIRKLDRAEQNLLRLSDVISEVQRQMRSLKRQVNAAIRHREYTEELRSLEIRNAWLQYNQLCGQISDLKDRFTGASERFEKSSAESSSQESLLEELNVQRLELERVLVARREGEHEIDTEMERIEGDIALLRKEVDFCVQQQGQAQQEHDDFQARASGITEAQGRTGEASNRLSEEVKSGESEAAEKQRAYEEAAEEVARADEGLDAARSRALETINTRNKTQTELETIDVGLANLDSQLDDIYKNQQAQHGRHEELSPQLQNAQRQEAEKQSSLTDTVARRQAGQEQRAERSERLQELNREWQELRERNSSDSARLNSLRELRDSYEGFAAGVRAVMRAKQEKTEGIRGIFGPVGDLVNTEKDYERAIEAALGGNINNVVVEEADAAKAAIQFLKSNRAGRVTFLPLDTIRSGSPVAMDELPKSSGIIGPAMDYVQCEAAVRPAVAYLLNHTVLVETIDDAIAIARSEHRFPRLVTLDGEVVSSAGAVTGGRTKHESRGLLGRSAEIEELEGRVSETGKHVEELGSEGQALASELETLTQEIKALSDGETSCRAELSDVGRLVAKFSTEMESIERLRRGLSDQRDALVEKRNDLETRRQAALERASSIDSDDEAVQREVAEAQQAAAAARQKLSGCSDALADLRVRLASLTQSLEEAERTREREAREHEAALEEATRRLDLISELKERQGEIEERVADYVERAKALSEGKGEAHAKVLDAQREQQVVLEKLESLGASLKKLRAATTEAQKEVHEIELDLSHKEDQVSFFQERILTEYNLALASLDEKEVGTDEYDEEEREALITDYRQKIQRLGTVNLGAIEEYEALEKRNDFLVAQDEDLRTARERLLGVVERIDATILEMFMETFRQVGENFKSYFRRLFNGGQARIYLLDEDDPLESGIEIEARPPGKKPQVISLLSGGEQAMTAIALLFSIFSAKPSPFCVLDEVDAPLDDANIGRFLDLVGEFTSSSQFIIITHNKQTMSRANALFGVTQQERGVSQLVSVRFDEVEDADTAA